VKLIEAGEKIIKMAKQSRELRKHTLEGSVMKRSLFVVAVAALCSFPVAASAQGLGILGGWAYGAVPNTNSSGAGTLHSNNGFAIGLSAQTGGMFGFGVDGLYAQRGFTSDVTGASRQLSYVDIPVYFRFAIPNHTVVPFVLAGPQVSIELNCNSNNGSCPSTDAKTTYDGVFAAGLKFPQFAHLSVQARYIYSLTDLNYTTINNQSNYHDRSFMLLLGIGF
jgi:hypothetical protein